MLSRKTPLRQKRPKPRRRAPERVKATRLRPKAGTPPTAQEKRHIGRIAALPCLLCRKPGPSTVHHVRHKVTRSGTFARSHRRVVPLCSDCHFHDHGMESVERVHEAGIYRRTGIDLWAEAERLWRQSQGD